MERWQEKRILILGTTYPTYSSKYTENVCTGGLEEGSLRMVRLHPVPLRYLDGSHRFHAFQWIRVQTKQLENDPRPESLRIDPHSIELEEEIQDHRERRRYLENSPSICQSVEELMARQKASGTSLGIVIPKRIDGVDIRSKGPKARREWEKKKQLLLSQGNLLGEELKDLDFPDLKLGVRWQCDDTTCKGHNMGLLQWGIHELARKLQTDPDRNAKICDAMTRRLDQTERDVFLVLGNFRAKLYNFGLVDSFSAPIRRREPLFEFLT
jgi:hypothetical protein